MGKRNEKSVKGNANSATSRSIEECLTPEPYTCTGNFSDDFTELWQRSGFDKNFMPVIRTRPKVFVNDEAKTEEDGGTIQDKLFPNSYTLTDNNIIFRPSIQVEYDIEETKQSQINYAKEIYIRSWKLEEKIINVLQLCMLERLQTINLWNAGITEVSLKSLSEFLPTLPSLKVLVLDGNPILNTEPYHLLLSNETLIQHLSLRNNAISDKGIELISHALSDANTRCPLLTLNISFNKITDKGAIEIAKALRMNRTLLSLSLASNFISNQGCKAIAHVLQRFCLTHDEVVMRRKLISQHDFAGRGFSAPASRRGEVKDRPGSNKSGSIVLTKGSRASSKKKQEKKADVLEKTSKKEDKSKKAAIGTADTGKGAKGKKSAVIKEGNKRATTVTSTVDAEPSELLEYTHPLLDLKSEQKDGKIYIPGCLTLVNLNLSRNQIGLEGLESMWKAVHYQSNRLSVLPTAPGLLRLSLQKNLFDVGHPTHQKILDVISSRDPLAKPDSQSPDEESVVS